MITICAHCEKLGYRNVLDVDGILDDRVSHGACRLSELEQYEKANDITLAERVELGKLRDIEGY